jgi:hypothetical protein
MIVTKTHKTRSDGVVLVRTYSDAGYQIEREGVLYSEAIDPADANRVYTETAAPVEVRDETEEKATAFDILMGVSE